VSSGFVLGNVWVMLVALSTMIFGLFIPAAYLGYLGVVPVVLGLRMLFQTHDDNPETPAPGGWLAVAAITFANSPDSLIVFGPLFIESEWLAVVGLVLGYMGCALIGLALVRVGMAQGAIAERAKHIAPKLIPWLMILVGGYILWDSTTDLV
jgi:cadmium resistance protein CadD (predicted permease)